MTNGTRESSGQGGIYAILVIIVVLIVAAVLYFGGILGGGQADDADIEIDIDAPAAPTTGS